MDYMEKHFSKEATHWYIIGAEKGDTVRVYILEFTLQGMKLIFSDMPTTSKRQVVVKYRSTKAKRDWLEAHATEAFDLCSISALQEARRTRYNRKGEAYTENLGECFEWLIARRYGVKQNDAANLAFTAGGDLVINGVAYQVKYERAGIAVTL